MKSVLITSLIAAFTVAANAETIRLTDTASGVSYGPFYFRHGQCITIAGSHWELIRLDPHHNAIFAETKALRLPALDFRDANLDDVVLFIRASIHRLGLENLDLVIRHDVKRTPPRTITLSIRNMSLHDVLEVIADQSGAQWRIRHGAIILEPDKGSISPLPIHNISDASGELYRLRNVASGNTMGPFQLNRKNHIQLDELIFEVTNDDASAARIQALKSMHIAQFDFRKADAEQAIHCLNESLRLVPDNPFPDMRIVLKNDGGESTSSLSCMMRNTSVYNTLDRLCEASGLAWSISDGNILLSEPVP